MFWRNKSEELLNPTSGKPCNYKTCNKTCDDMQVCKKDNEMEENCNCVPSKMIHNEKSTLIIWRCPHILYTNYTLEIYFISCFI